VTGSNQYTDSTSLFEKIKGIVFEWILLAATLLGILSLFVLLVYVTLDALAVFNPDQASWLTWELFTQSYSRHPEEAGLFPPLIGSILIITTMTLAVFPLGVGAAIYLEEYAQDSLPKQLIQINISNLAGVPSVVYGLLGLAVFVNAMELERGLVITAAFTLGFLVLPIVVVSAQEALRSVPDSLRKASYGMGASRWQTIRRVVLPRALPGILTGTILAIGRAVGETAPLIMIGVATTVFRAPSGIFDKASALPLQIYAWASFPEPEFRYGVVAASVVVLVGLMLLFNGLAVGIRYYFETEH
jgi:phosphate transport system permease protein